MSNRAIRCFFLAALATVVAFLLNSCASTRLAEEWHDPGRTGPALAKVLVMGVSTQARVRRTFEDVFVRQIKERGADAVASYTLIAEDGKVDREQILKAVAESSADGVLITRLVERQFRSRNTPGAIRGSSVTPLARDVYAPYSEAWVGYFEPSIQSEHVTLTLETKVYDVRTQAVAWTGASETKDPKSATEIATQLAPIVVNALVKAKLL